MVEVLNAILGVAELIPKNENDRTIIKYNRIPGFDTLLFDERGEGFLFSQSSKKMQPIISFSEEQLYDMFELLDAGKHHLTSRATLIERNLDEKIWYIKPKEIKSGEETIGMIGVSIEEIVNDKELKSVVFISPDGSFSTLTMFDDFDNSKELAKDDLQKIGEAIKGFEL